MSKYKNTLMIIVSIILLAYAAFTTVVPAVLTETFNVDKFEEKVFEATSLLTTVDSVQYKIKPNLTTEIIVRNFSLKYIDEQPLFNAGYIEIKASPSIIFGKNFNLKSLYMKNVHYADQILPTGENKIAFLPSAFNSEIFGAKSITVVPSSIRVKNLKLTYVTPTTYKERNIREKTFDKTEVSNFLKSLQFSHVNIK